MSVQPVYADPLCTKAGAHNLPSTVRLKMQKSLAKITAKSQRLMWPGPVITGSESNCQRSQANTANETLCLEHHWCRSGWPPTKRSLGHCSKSMHALTSKLERAQGGQTENWLHNRCLPNSRGAGMTAQIEKNSPLLPSPWALHIRYYTQSLKRKR